MSRSHVRNDYQLIQIEESGEPVGEFRLGLPLFKRSCIVDQYHSLWEELHSGIRTKEQFDDWLDRVPNKDCGCRVWLTKYINDNPPVFEAFVGWGFELHNAVNRKLGKKEFSWNDFEAKYQLSAF